MRQTVQLLQLRAASDQLLQIAYDLKTLLFIGKCIGIGLFSVGQIVQNSLKGLARYGLEQVWGKVDSVINRAVASTRNKSAVRLKGIDKKNVILGKIVLSAVHLKGHKSLVHHDDFDMLV